MNHNTINFFEKTVEMRDVRNGILTPTMFQAVCQSGKEKINKDELEQYLLGLGLAVKMKNDEMFLPSLISEENQVENLIITKSIDFLLSFTKFWIQMLNWLFDSSRTCLMPVHMRSFSVS